MSVIPWKRFCKTVAEAEALARPEEFDAFQNLGEHYAGIIPNCGVRLGRS